MRKVKEDRPEVEGMGFMLRPPRSNEVRVFSGGFGAVGRGASEGAAVEDGWLAARPFGGDPEVGAYLDELN